MQTQKHVLQSHTFLLIPATVHQDSLLTESVFDLPVVKRSLASVAGLDSDREGIIAVPCEVGVGEVKGGRERLRITGW